MRVVAAVHALWLCGTEKCPFDFATDGGRLYCCRAYTDDPYFLAVSVERWIRLISHWHDVVLITGLRMAGAHKHQAGIPSEPNAFSGGTPRQSSLRRRHFGGLAQRRDPRQHDARLSDDLRQTRSRDHHHERV